MVWQRNSTVLEGRLYPTLSTWLITFMVRGLTKTGYVWLGSPAVKNLRNLWPRKYKPISRQRDDVLKKIDPYLQ